MPKRNHRRKELSESQKLKQIVREQKAEIRSLQKRLRQLEHTKHIYEEVITEIEAEEDELPPRERCPDCSKGFMVWFYVCGRSWSECDLCNYRTKTIKNES